MEYKETHLSYDKGLKVLGLALLIALIFYGGFFLALSSGKYDGFYSFEKELNIENIAIYLFQALWLIGTTFCVGTLCLIGFRQISSKKDWVVRINKSEFFHQAPHEDIGRSFSIPIASIQEIKKIEYSDGDDNIYYKWYVTTDDHNKRGIHENSPFNLDLIAQTLCKNNSKINYVEILLK